MGVPVLSCRSSGLERVLGRPQTRHSPFEALVAKEVALEYSDTSFEPRIFEHVAGISNVLADKLSRLYEPGAGAQVPHELVNVMKAEVPTRDKRYYKILATS